MSVDLVERVGTARGDVVVSRLAFLPRDDYSTTSLELPAYTNGRPVVSCERWCRLRFNQPFGVITDMRFWATGLGVDTGWAFLYGLTDSFEKPRTGESVYATAAVPEANPGFANLSPGPLGEIGSDPGYSPWLVLQAVCGADAPSGPIPSLSFTFSWTST